MIALPMLYTNLIQRTLEFSIAVRKLCQAIPTTLINENDKRQLIRSSSSIGANFIEATEKLGPKDLIYRLKISLKEAKETTFWLKNLDAIHPNNKDISSLIDESDQLKSIIASMIHRIKNK